MASSIEEIKSSFGDGAIKEFEEIATPKPQKIDINREIVDLNARIEAIVDLLVSLGFCKEQEYSFAVDNVLSRKPEVESESFEDYLVKRRMILIQNLKDAGLRP